MDDVIAYGVGIVYACACAPKDTPIEEVEAAVNEQHPTGLSHGWAKSSDETFSGGQSNPCPCNSDPSRLHWLLSC
jgi:hypothetical protein